MNLGCPAFSAVAGDAFPLAVSLRLFGFQQAVSKWLTPKDFSKQG